MERSQRRFASSGSRNRWNIRQLCGLNKTGCAQGFFKSSAARYIQLMPQNRITIDPAVCNGKPTIRGMRITVQTVLEYLSAGESQEEILRQFSMLEPEDISACLSFAGKL